jgi:hypothetical protein
MCKNYAVDAEVRTGGIRPSTVPLDPAKWKARETASFLAWVADDFILEYIHLFI